MPVDVPAFHAVFFTEPEGETLRPSSCAPIKAMVLGEASIEKKTSSKAKNLICILGEKGKVLLTVFSDQ
jgi:hypothetical protein